MNHPFPRPRRGFTLVELLTVIGIIVVLISILLPTVGKVRIAGAVASTQQQMATIAGAIERYRAEQGAFPGVLPNAQFDPGTGKATVTPGNVEVTMTESLTLALCGGLSISGSNIAYDESLIGRGASSLGPDVARRKRYPAYIDPTPGQMMPDQPWSGNGRNGTADTAIPEFMDRFQVSKPILYMRALVGAPGVVPGYPGSTTAATAQYHPALLAPYGFPTDNTEFQTEFPQDNTATPTVPAGFGRYMKLPTQAQARGKDAFVLISAGPDNRFGTKDDIFYPS